jgi:hypothetical protein
MVDLLISDSGCETMARGNLSYPPAFSDHIECEFQQLPTALSA